MINSKSSFHVSIGYHTLHIGSTVILILEVHSFIKNGAWNKTAQFGSINVFLLLIYIELTDFASPFYRVFHAHYLAEGSTDSLYVY